MSNRNAYHTIALGKPSLERKPVKPVCVVKAPLKGDQCRLFIEHLKSHPSLREFKFLNHSDHSNDDNNKNIKTSIYQNICLIDLSDIVLTKTKAGNFVNSIAKGNVSLLFLVNTTTPETAIQILSQQAIVLPNDLQPEDLAIQLKFLHRIKSMRYEAQLRRKSLQLNDYNNPILPHTNPKVLIAGSPNQHILSMVNTLCAHGYNFECTYRPAQSIRALESEFFDALVVFPKNESDPLLALAKSLKRHTRYKAMPVITICDTPQATSGGPFQGITLKSNHIDSFGACVVTSQMNCMKELTATKAYLHKVGAEEQRYLNTPVYKPNSFSSRLNEQARDPSPYHQWYISVCISAAEDVCISREHMLDQSGHILNQILRSEDFLCHISAKDKHVQFAAIINEGGRQEIKKISDRLTGFINNTMFHDDDDNPISLHAYNSYFPHEDGAHAEEIVAKILRGN